MSNPFKKSKIESRQELDEIGNIVKNREIEHKKSEEKPSSKKIDEKEKPEPIRLSDEEIKTLLGKAKRKYFDLNRAVVFLSVLGIMGIVFFYQMVEEVNPMQSIIMVLFGMLCFLPLGFICGWLFLDPYMRCKIMRRFRGRNYGIVNFVHKGGQRVDQRIKNLDDDIVVQGTKLWVLDKTGIYYVDKDNNKIFNSVVDPRAMVTLPNNVPMLSLDAESMLPLKYHEEETKTNPQQIGAVTLGYINNQVAKNLFFKRQMTYFYIVSLVLHAVTICGIMLLYDELVGF